MSKFLKLSQKKLKKLTYQQQILFVSLLCEKLLPNYTFFNKRTNWGSILKYSNVLEWIYNHSLNPEYKNIKEINKKIECLSKLYPDIDEFPNEFSASYALDACCAMESVLVFIQKGSLTDAVKVVSTLMDSLDMYIQQLEDMDPADALLEDKIQSHQLMKLEMASQENIIQTLQKMPIINKPIIEQLRLSVNRFPVSINLELINI
ncbi:MAG: hypothetical protein RL329_1919 [Bacteroidota bacterium]|jgi:uncharacterized protein YjaG (DUF416 family)